MCKHDLSQVEKKKKRWRALLATALGCFNGTTLELEPRSELHLERRTRIVG